MSTYETYQHTFYQFAKDQLFTRFHVPEYKFTGQTVIVTGSNIGLGFEAARHISKLDCGRLILAVRSIAKGEAAAKSIRSTLPPSSNCVVEVWSLDLSDYQSIKDFIRRADELERLDVLLENAGLVTLKWTDSDGEDLQVKTNVTGTMLLAFGLLPKLRKTGIEFKTDTHLSIVSSGAHKDTTLWEAKEERNIYDAMNDRTRPYDAQRVYPLTKLMEIFLVRELGRHSPYTSQSPVVINCINPGLCYSNLNADLGWVTYMVELLRLFLAKSTVEGSLTLLYGAIGGADTHGSYMSECLVRPPAPYVLSDDGKIAQERLWRETVEKLEVILPGVTSSIVV